MNLKETIEMVKSNPEAAARKLYVSRNVTMGQVLRADEAVGRGSSVEDERAELERRLRMALSWAK